MMDVLNFISKVLLDLYLKSPIEALPVFFWENPRSQNYIIIAFQAWVQIDWDWLKDVGAAEDEAGQREGEQEHHAEGQRRQSHGKSSTSGHCGQKKVWRAKIEFY